MTRQIISANQIQLAEETVNKDYPYPSETHKVSGESLIETVKQAIVEIDADIKAIDDNLVAIDGDIATITTDIGLVSADVGDVADDVAGLQFTKQDTKPEAITSITRDGNGRITAVVQPTQQVNTITYDGNGVLQSYRTVTKNAAGANVTHQVTINRDGNGLITSTTVTVV